jgi:hypothetical protein
LSDSSELAAPAGRTPTVTTMWETVAAPDRLPELIAWLRPRIPAEAGLYCSAEDGDRVVVIDPTGVVGATLADIPDELNERPPHHWDFRPL